MSKLEKEKIDISRPEGVFPTPHSPQGVTPRASGAIELEDNELSEIKKALRELVKLAEMVHSTTKIRLKWLEEHIEELNRETNKWKLNDVLGQIAFTCKIMITAYGELYEGVQDIRWQYWKWQEPLLTAPRRIYWTKR